MQKISYPKRATNVLQQINFLKEKGILILNTEKAKEFLLDIGYYRLGFYSYFFEETYPELEKKRQHKVAVGTTIENIVALYYFDFDLRNILNRFLSRIETAVRTKIIYELSNKYQENPFWFVDEKVVSQKFINNFDSKIYNVFICNKSPIIRHHKKYKDKYAPAWKTCEFFTLGNTQSLYDALTNNDKKLISRNFNEPAIKIFSTYLLAIRDLRNACAHGNTLIGLTLTNGIRTGKACAHFIENQQQTFSGALKVVDFFLRTISENRRQEMWQKINDSIENLRKKIPEKIMIIIENQFVK